MRFKSMFAVLLVMLFMSSFAAADVIGVSLDGGNHLIHQFSSPFLLFGSLTNTGNADIFVNGVTATTDWDDMLSYDFMFQPAFLAVGGSSDELSFFTFQWRPVAPGSDLNIVGAFQFYGGSSANSQDILATVVFDDVVLGESNAPEPAGLALLGTGMIGLAGMVRRKVAR